MQRLKYLIILMCLLIAQFACDSETPVETQSELAVVRAYLYANEPVYDVQITKTLALGSEDTLAPPINDAEVILIKEGQEFLLTPSDGDSGYYHYTGDDLVVSAGDEFEIRVTCLGKTATGITYVPSAPENLEISGDELIIEEFSFDEFPGERPDFTDSTNQLLVSWENPDLSLYYVVVANIDDDPEEIESEDGFMGRMPVRFVSVPTSMDEYQVNRMTLTHYGKHAVKVYRINQEYADLYQSRNQDSRDLNEPLTNIENGLGVFSAFNSATVYFNAVPDE